MQGLHSLKTSLKTSLSGNVGRVNTRVAPMPSQLKASSHQLVRQLPYTKGSTVEAIWPATIGRGVEKGGQKRTRLLGARNRVEGPKHAVERSDTIVWVADGYLQQYGSHAM